MLTITDKDVLNNVKIYTSSERRVIVSTPLLSERL